MSKNTSLTRRMTLWFAVVVIAVVAILGVLNMTLFNRGMSDSLINTLEAVAKNSAEGMALMTAHTDMLYQMVTDSKFTNSDQAYISFLLGDDADLMTDIQRFQELMDIFRKDCRIMLGSIFDSWSANIFLAEDIPLYSKRFVSQISLDRILQTYMEFENVNIVKNTLAREEAWYRRALAANGNSYWFEKNGFICMARSISSLNQSSSYGDIHYHEMGVLLLAFRSSFISNFVFSGQYTENNCAFLYNEDGETIWSSQTQIPQNALEISNAIDGGLKLSMYVPYGDISKMTDNTARTLGLFLLLCAGLGGVLVLMVSGWITRPVRLLSAFMKEKNGQLLSDDMIPKQKDEIHDLYASYNELIHTIRAEEEKRRKAEMDYLQLQINPHFLYNTLDSVCFLAMTAGQNEIADTLSNLAGIYRYNIKNADGEVTLREELTIVKQYIDIYRFRSSDRIKYKMDVDEAWMEAIVPKMILQPLVENAILYGSEGRECTVQIGCARNGNDMCIQVTDAGTNADTDRINDYLQEKGDLSVHSTGIAIKNVHQRIRMRYGEPYGLFYSKSRQGTTSAGLLLPFKQKQ